MPVGRWVMRTAESVVLTCWPPAPEDAHRVDADVGGGDVDVDRLGLGQDGDGGGRGVDATARLGLGHALDAVDAGFEFQPGEDALALDASHEFLDAAEVGQLFFEDLEAPAHALGVALVHLLQVGGEERCFLAAGAGADFQDRRAGVGGVLGQEGEAEGLFHLGDAGLEAGEFLFGEAAHLGVGEHRLGLVAVGEGLAVGGDLGHHGAEGGIFAGEVGDFGWGAAGVEAGFEEFEAGLDLGEFVERNHAGGFRLKDGEGQVVRPSPLRDEGSARPEGGCGAPALRGGSGAARRCRDGCFRRTGIACWAGAERGGFPGVASEAGNLYCLQSKRYVFILTWP